MSSSAGFNLPSPISRISGDLAKQMRKCFSPQGPNSVPLRSAVHGAIPDSGQEDDGRDWRQAEDEKEKDGTLPAVPIPGRTPISFLIKTRFGVR